MTAVRSPSDLWTGHLPFSGSHLSSICQFPQSKRCLSGPGKGRVRSRCSGTDSARPGRLSLSGPASGKHSAAPACPSPPLPGLSTSISQFHAQALLDFLENEFAFRSSTVFFQSCSVFFSNVLKVSFSSVAWEKCRRLALLCLFQVSSILMGQPTQVCSHCQQAQG